MTEEGYRVEQAGKSRGAAQPSAADQRHTESRSLRKARGRPCEASGRSKERPCLEAYHERERRSLIRLKTFRYRIYPNSAQLDRMAHWECYLRWLWNLAHEQRKMIQARPKGERKFVTAFDQSKEATELRAEYPWFADVPSSMCGQLLVELDKAWQRYFSRVANEPRWKKRTQDGVSLCLPNKSGFRLDQSRSTLRVCKLGNVRTVVHRPLEGRQKTCTLRQDVGQWFASIVCEVEMPEPSTRTLPVVAIDRGIVNIVGDSNGNLIPSPRFFRASSQRLNRAKRSVSRKKKGSKNRDKAKMRLAVLKRKVRRQRIHVLHFLSRRYANRHGTIVIEKLNTRGMMRLSRVLSRDIVDSGWTQLARMLAYKLAWSGGTLVEVPAAYSSQTCSECGCVDAASRASQSVFSCTSCGHTEHADLNAPKVLLARANRPGLPVEGTCSAGTQRSRKRAALRVPRTFTRKPRAKSCRG